MVEPTENENKARIDQYVKIVEEEMDKARENPDYTHAAPQWVAVGRVDDGWSVRKLIMSWKLYKEKKATDDEIP
ncbi:MAG: hypothetical protein ACTSSG_12765 [Candidatus Heimdallarchaeaceae archaeon]